MRDVSPNANMRVNFSAISFGGAAVALRRPCIISVQFLFGDTVQERCDVQHDAAAKAQGGSQFHSSARLMQQRDIARYSGSTAAACA